jgi:spore coat protein U-like protein
MRSAFTVFALGILAPGLALRPSVAATASGSFSVSVTVQVSCQASAMAVRSYTDAAANATPSVSVTCSKSTPYYVSLSAGMASSATAANRAMTGSGGALLGHVLSSHPRGIVSGQAVGADAIAGSGIGAAQVLANHDQMSAGQYVAAGPNVDTIRVIVTY